MNQRDNQQSDLPAALAQPARRALDAAGYTRLEQLTQISETEILKFHGMGPRALDELRHALRAQGLSFRDGGDSRSSP